MRVTPPSREEVADPLIEDVVAALGRGETVRRTVRDIGRLYIDRPVPFLCLYRRPVSAADTGTERLVTGTAAYLAGSLAPVQRKRQTALVRAIVGALQERFGASLLIEVWAAPTAAKGADGTRPVARVLGAGSEQGTPLAEVLGNALVADRRLSARFGVELHPAAARSVDRRVPSVLSTAEARALSCTRIGLQVPPVYRDQETGAVFPIVLRAVRRGVDVALRKTAFAFAKSHTSRRPRDYHVLGRRALSRDALQVDGQLSGLARSFDFLLSLTPINADRAWRAFSRKRSEKPPNLYYRPLTVDVSDAKRKLFSVPMERIEDPTMADLLREKQFELDRQLTILAERGSRRVLYGSLQLYGKVDDSLLRQAERLIELIPPGAREGGKARPVTAEAFAAAARDEIASFGLRLPSAAETAVEIRDDLAAGLMVSRGRLLVGAGLTIPGSRVRALIQHEVGTHVLTYLNGKSQRLQLLSAGLANYDETQEGLAVLAEYLVGGLSKPRLRLLAARVVAVSALVGGATFVDVYRQLLRYGFSRRTAYGVTVRVFRGGGLTKDAVYLRGLIDVLGYLASGEPLEPLFVGKVALAHVGIIRELLARKVLVAPPLLPSYLGEDGARSRLAGLRQGRELHQLID